MTALEFSYLTHTTQTSTRVLSVVWSVDSNLDYFGHPHIILFLSGLATLLTLSLPFTILLLLEKCLQKLPNHYLRHLNWMQLTKKSIRDIYLAPLKDKHRYWFVLARVILLMTFASTFAVPQYINLLLLLVVGASLTFYVAVIQPYKHTTVLTVNCMFFLNLTLLAGFEIVDLESYWPTLQNVAVWISTGFAFLQFCGIVLYLPFKTIYNYAGHYNSDKQEDNADNEIFKEIDCDYNSDAPVNTTDEAQPLLSSVRNNDGVTY